MNTKRFFLLRGAASLATLPPLTGMLTACKEEVARLGDTAPELAALDLHGNPAKLAQWRGKPLYLNFWSAGCAVCLNEMPRLETLSRQCAGRVQVIAVNLDPENISIDAALRRVKVSFPLLRDTLGITRERYRVEGTPRAFVIDARGLLRHSIAGAPPPGRLEQVFSEMAAAKI